MNLKIEIFLLFILFNINMYFNQKKNLCECVLCRENKKNFYNCIMKNKICKTQKEIYNGCKGEMCFDCYDKLQNYRRCPFCNMEELDNKVNKYQERIYPNYLKKLQSFSLILFSIILFTIIFIIKFIFTR